MVFNPNLVKDVLGLQSLLFIQVVGAVLVVIALDLLHQVTRHKLATWRALYASLDNIAGAAATAILLALYPNALSDLGFLWVTSLATIEFILGACLFWAAGFVYKVSGKNVYRHCIPVFVDAPADKMWSIISQFKDIHKYSPFLKSSRVLDDKRPGIGAIRACEDQKGNQWREECVDFDEGSRVTLRFLAEDPNFPLPASKMQGGWEITPRENGCDVIVWWELSPKPKYMAPIILPLFAFKMDRDFPSIIQNMALNALDSSKETKIPKHSKPRVSVLPDFC